MQINQLKINHFRCYDDIELNFNERINVFSGENGSGKTSVLEAIYYLSTGKSFRSKRTKNLIKHDQDGFALFSSFTDTDKYHNQLGISLSKTLKKKVKFNQNLINSQSKIAHVLPVVAIDSNSYLFLDKPPQYRRSFFDWLVFHVKPQYLQIWSNVSRCHKHLNVLYKEKKVSELDYWESQYIEYANQLTVLRKEIYQQLVDSVQRKIQFFVPELESFKTTFKQGWNKEKTLLDQLNADRDKNLLYGSLVSGTHKMDLKNTYNQLPAYETLSRGQKKIISSIFYLSYIELLTNHLGINPILCLDDMDAELDINKTAVFNEFIENSVNQIFLTTVAAEKLTSSLSTFSLFHVKHNQIKNVSSPI